MQELPCGLAAEQGGGVDGQAVDALRPCKKKNHQILKNPKQTDPEPGGGDLSWRSRSLKRRSWEGGTLTVHLGTEMIF